MAAGGAREAGGACEAALPQGGAERLWRFAEGAVKKKGGGRRKGRGKLCWEGKIRAFRNDGFAPGRCAGSSGEGGMAEGQVLGLGRAAGLWP